jgi:O-6-methylguanine DNA methyltransferase
MQPTIVNHSTATDIVIIGHIPTPMGSFEAVCTSRGLAQLSFPSAGESPGRAWVRKWMPHAGEAHDSTSLSSVSEQLNAYLEGTLRAFSLPLDLRGTPFQLSVWQALLDIPYGEIRSYGDIARAIGRPNAVRAVGAANGANPVAIVVPCHRVIGSSGKLVGYGGGLDIKERFLRLERGEKRLI